MHCAARRADCTVPVARAWGRAAADARWCASRVVAPCVAREIGPPSYTEIRQSFSSAAHATRHEGDPSAAPARRGTGSQLRSAHGVHSVVSETCAALCRTTRTHGPGWPIRHATPHVDTFEDELHTSLVASLRTGHCPLHTADSTLFRVHSLTLTSHLPCTAQWSSQDTHAFSNLTSDLGMDLGEAALRPSTRSSRVKRHARRHILEHRSGPRLTWPSSSRASAAPRRRGPHASPPPGTPPRAAAWRPSPCSACRTPRAPPAA